MDVLILIGRVLFSVLFLVSAFGHLTKREMMSGYAASRGVPAARVLVPLTGVQLGVGAVMVALGLWPDLGALILFVFLLPTAFLMHAFWKESDPQSRAMERVQFLKDLSLAGAALVLFAAFASLGGDLHLVIAGPLFNFR
ncbi:UNVERIFIED_ORG: putative oxidoreductase [Arthrobacter sp. UYCu721]